MDEHGGSKEAGVGGVSLAAFAGARAGIAEGFDLALVLAAERIDPAAWEAAEGAWDRRLAEDAEGDGALGEAFDEHQADARERYGRRLPPIDEDLAAWLDFHRRFSAAPDPPALLAEVGVRPAEVARLHRTWSRRAAADPALAAETRALLQREPGPLPVPTPAPRALDLPAALPPAFHSASPPDEEPGEGDDGAPPLFVPLPEWDVVDEPAPRPPEAVPLVPLPAVIDETLPETLSPLRGPALPFAPPVPGAPRAPIAVTSAPAPRVGDGLGRTLDAPLISPFAAGQALPFAEGKPAVAPAAAAPRSPASPVALDEGQTVMGVISPFAAGKALPFGPRASAAPPPAAAPPAALGRTLDAPLISPFAAGKALPFAEGKSAAPPHGEPRPTASPAPPVLDETRIGSVISPFALPFAERAGGPAPPAAALPTLTLEQYASLCSELSVFAAQEEAVFARYGLGSRPLRAAANVAWTARLRQNQAEYAEWQALYRRYHAYWTEIARRGREEGR